MEKLKHFKSPCYHHGELSPRERITLPLSEIGPDTDKVIDCRASKTGAMLFRKWLQFEGKYKIKHQLTSGPKFQFFFLVSRHFNSFSIWAELQHKEQVEVAL